MLPVALRSMYMCSFLEVYIGTSFLMHIVPHSPAVYKQWIKGSKYPRNNTTWIIFAASIDYPSPLCWNSTLLRNWDPCHEHWRTMSVIIPCIKENRMFLLYILFKLNWLTSISGGEFSWSLAIRRWVHIHQMDLSQYRGMTLLSFKDFRL